MPNAAIVTELRFVNELATTGKFYIVAGTYGRGVYVREVNDAAVGVENDRPGELLKLLVLVLPGAAEMTGKMRILL